MVGPLTGAAFVKTSPGYADAGIAETAMSTKTFIKPRRRARIFLENISFPPYLEEPEPKQLRNAWPPARLLSAATKILVCDPPLNWMQQI
jgi:hypothetical protein